MRALITAFVSLFVLATPLGAVAQAVSTPVETENATSQLVSKKAGITPGETVRIGLYQELREGWHVYWENPGDSGLPLDLDWTLPAGFEAGEITYPVPHRIPLGPLVNYGHEGTPLFSVPLSAPEDAATGQTVTLSVDATWLICADICIPESATLSISLPVLDAPAGDDPLGGPLFDEADAQFPEEGNLQARWYDVDGDPVLKITGDLSASDEPFFFAAPIGVVEPAGEQRLHDTQEGVRFVLEAAFDYDPAALGTIDGVIALDDGDYRGISISAQKTDAPENAAALIAAGPATADTAADARNDPAAGGAPASQNLFLILVFAFLGGLILNVMPCVFPVIFIKAANLARSAQEDRGTVVRHGLIYTLGILAAFTAIAGLLLVLRAGGEEIGWGFHLQSPITVAVFAIVIFLVGLNLAGVFEIGTSVQGVGSGLAAKGGNSGAFFTGLLAVAVAAPCIGPFLGVPVGFALSAQQPAVIGLLVFIVMGLGLALPYLLLSLMPGLAKVLPKPGPWMVTFKQVLSFAMFATLIWLIWTLTLQAGTDGLVLLLVALLLTGIAAWAFGRSQEASGGWVSRGLAVIAVAATVVVIAGITPQDRLAAYAGTAPGEGDLSKLPSVAYSEETLEELRAAGTPVFVDFTAAWCVTCQVNKQTVLTRQQVVSQFHDKGVVYMVADWTVQDPEITRALEAQGRSGVPLYLFYAPGAVEAEVLPQVLSFDIMRETFSVL